MPRFFRFIKIPIDIIITLFFWFYFISGYVFFSIPIFLFMLLITRDKESVMQKINHIFYRIFFLLLNSLTPGLNIKISDEVKNIQSAVVIANHRSYLDPILFISLFPKHKTIVKGVFFKVPIMRWVMKFGGYLPFETNGKLKNQMVEGIQDLSSFLQKGGVIFIFPEGKRSRNGKLGKFQKGAFSIAGMYNVPVEVLYIMNTDRLFTPGRFLFNTCIKNTITVEKLGTIRPEQRTHSDAIKMRDKVLQLYIKRINDNKSV